MGKVCRYDNCNNEYSFNFWGKQSLEDMLAIIDHMTINANGRFHNHVNDDEGEASEDRAR